MDNAMTPLSYAQWLQQAAVALEALAATDPMVDVRLESRRLLADVLNISPTALMTRWSDPLPITAQQQLAQALTRRLTGEPLAYITGRWWFWDLELEVAPCTLIPRPDTELLVEQALALSLPTQAKVLDLGTGTGAIALALANSRPDWQVTAVDFQADAVALASRNRDRLGLKNCQVLQSDWYQALHGGQFDLIVSNPPYIDAADPHLQQGDVRFEPASALVAPEQGLADIAQICAGAIQHLQPHGWLWLEHGYLQAEAVQQLLRQVGLSNVTSKRDYGGQWRITGGQR